MSSHSSHIALFTAALLAASAMPAAAYAADEAQAVSQQPGRQANDGRTGHQQAIFGQSAEQFFSGTQDLVTIFH